MRAKIMLALKYGLLPPELPELITLLASMDHPDGKTTEKMNKQLREAAAILQRHPNSVFACELHFTRGFLLARLGRAKEADEAYKRSLTVPYKDVDRYSTALSNLAHSTNPHIAAGYTEAQKEYFRRKEQGDPFLPRLGVNDFLEKRGLL